MPRKTPGTETSAAMAALLFMPALSPVAYADTSCICAAACGDTLDET